MKLAALIRGAIPGTTAATPATPQCPADGLSQLSQGGNQGNCIPPVATVAGVAGGSAAQNGAPTLGDLDCDAVSASVAARLLARAAAPDRDAFALKNHAEAIRHFRRVAEETERLAAMYRSKIDAHVDAARQRLGSAAEFDEWLGKI